MINFVMQSRLNSVLVVFLLSASIFILPPVFVLSSSILGLIVMRQGFAEVAIVAGVVMVLWLLIGYMFDMKIPSYIIIALWLPVIICGQQIKSHSKLDAMFLPLVTVMSFCWLIIFFSTNQNPTAFWLSAINQHLLPAMNSIDGQAEIIDHIQKNADNISQSMTAAVILSIAFLTIISVIIGRSWQARLYNPGGFTKEFKSSQLGKPITIIGLTIIAMSFLTDILIFNDLQSVCILLFIFQGLAIIHSLLSGRNTAKPLLILTYLTLFLLPIIPTLIAILGAVDTWGDFRQRFGSQNAV